MRININSQELTDEAEIIEDVSKTGKVYTGIRFIFHSSPLLHHSPQDDDRSAVTFWLPKSPDRRMAFAKLLQEMSVKILDAKPE